MNRMSQAIACTTAGLLLTSFATVVHAQVPASERGYDLEPEGPRAQVLLLGTFHFRDAGLDDFQPQVDVDIFSPERQSELEQVLERLASFTPGRIAVEWPVARQAALDSAYTAYRTGDLELTANEVHQIGFRLAEWLGHDQLFAIDAAARWYDPEVSTEVLIERAQSLGQTELIGRAMGWMERYEAYHAQVDSMKSTTDLAEYLLYLNSPEHLRRSHGQYLVGQIEVGGDDDYIGADTRTAWFNRNIRIFSNIQRLVRGTEERVLVVIGSGHVPILRQLIEGSPELKLVDPRDYLGPHP